jgi:hypothetical protein
LGKSEHTGEKTKVCGEQQFEVELLGGSSILSFILNVVESKVIVEVNSIKTSRDKSKMASRLFEEVDPVKILVDAGFADDPMRPRTVEQQVRGGGGGEQNPLRAVAVVPSSRETVPSRSSTAASLIPRPQQQRVTRKIATRSTPSSREQRIC